MRIPQLAIHLNRGVNDDGLKLNPQTHLTPILGQDSADAEGGPSSGEFLIALAERLGVDVEAILAWDLCLYDVQPPVVSGLGSEFIHAPRLDNQAMCHAGLLSLTACEGEAAETRVLALFDHEEIGSASASGADSTALPEVLERLCGGRGSDDLSRALRRSLMLSCDMAHAIHPNYADRHDPRHLPAMNAGPVIKANANVRYASDAETIAAFVRLCQDAEIPYQRFVMRSDLACGSTIGPIIASRLGMPSVDVGNAMLSMHSAREMGGARDPWYMVRALDAFWS